MKETVVEKREAKAAAVVEMKEVDMVEEETREAEEMVGEVKVAVAMETEEVEMVEAAMEMVEEVMVVEVKVMVVVAMEEVVEEKMEKKAMVALHGMAEEAAREQMVEIQQVLEGATKPEVAERTPVLEAAVTLHGTEEAVTKQAAEKRVLEVARKTVKGEVTAAATKEQTVHNGTSCTEPEHARTRRIAPASVAPAGRPNNSAYHRKTPPSHRPAAPR